jgi:hypothetical protein
MDIRQEGKCFLPGETWALLQEIRLKEVAKCVGKKC